MELTYKQRKGVEWIHGMCENVLEGDSTIFEFLDVLIEAREDIIFDIEETR